MQPWWRQLPQTPPPARFILETKKKIVPLCGQMRFFLCDARPEAIRPKITSAVTNRTLLVKCRLVGTKRSLLQHLERLGNSKRRVCHSALTTHLFLMMLKLRLGKLRGVGSFRKCIENVASPVSAFLCSGHLGNLGLSWLGLAWLTWLGLAWPSRFWFQTGSPEDAKPILAPASGGKFS